MLIRDLLLEKKGNDKEKKLVFVETDPTGQTPFPMDTFSSLKKAINKEAKDLEKKWSSAIDLVDYVFEDLVVPKPGASLKVRFRQYLDLLKIAVDDLGQARGMNDDWTSVII